MLATAPSTPSLVRVLQILIIIPHLVARARTLRRARDKDLAVVALGAVLILAAAGRAVIHIVVASELAVDGAIAVAHKVDGAAAHAAAFTVKGRRDILVVEVARVFDFAWEVVLGAVGVRVVVEVVPGCLDVADGYGEGVGCLDVFGKTGDLIFGDAIGPFEA